MRLSIISRITEVEGGVICWCRKAEADNSLRDHHNPSDDVILFYHSFKIIPSLKQAKTFLPRSKVSSSSIVCLSARLGDKGLFSTPNILQLADVFCRVVFLVFMLCFWPIVCLFLPCETSKMFRQMFSLPKQTNFLVNCSVNNLAILLQFWCYFSHIAKFFQIWLTVAGYNELCVGF